MKKYSSILLLFTIVTGFAQKESNAQQFWNNLKSYCGQSYEGTVLEAPENDSFRGQKLVMHVRSCSENEIKIPFFVGEDKSRTWVLKLKDNAIQLKHDHRHKDGTPDEVTMYGGTSSNAGFSTIQFFPADVETAELIEYASTNLWWITLNETTFTYNLRRIGTNRFFSISFDLTKPIESPEAPWGWKN
ncbi:hypothetical protein [Lutibacter sp.]|uniref:hypothetical protein n=1 Tax=Lutibacter sp. TaxID=1925666 RepID=UPI002734FA6A|nr:hypothetical protein [Lutibacter sp.]MDP3312380.1 hypothetical protein [Lutibacter sp.]